VRRVSYKDAQRVAADVLDCSDVDDAMEALMGHNREMLPEMFP